MKKQSGSKWVWTLALVAIVAVYFLSKNGNALLSPQGRSVEQASDERQGIGQQGEEDDATAAGGMELPATTTSDQYQIIKRTGYTVAYDKATRLPRWVAWHLTADHTNGKFSRDGLRFMEDTDVPKPRATSADYSNTGYDHGHLCPSGDNKWSRQAQVQTFLYTNCCPQVHGLNAGDWNDIEQRCRLWAETYGSVYIVCGPVLDNGTKHKTIGRNKVVVPERFFKVVLRYGDERTTPKAIGFVCDNEPSKNAKANLVRTVDEVEEITGFDFFPQLPDDIETKVESAASLNDWAKFSNSNGL